MKNKKTLIIISILIILVILFFVGKNYISKKNSTTSDERYTFNENDSKYSDYVFYDVEWYDETLNETNVYDDFNKKRLELIEENTEETNENEVRLNKKNYVSDSSIDESITVRIENGKLIYKNKSHEYISENIKNVKKVMKHITSLYGYEYANIVVLTIDGDIYYSDDIDSIRYNASLTEIENFDKTFKKLEATIKFNNIKSISYEYKEILIAENDNKKVYYDYNSFNDLYYFEFNKKEILFMYAAQDGAYINNDATIVFNGKKEQFSYNDKNIYVQKIFDIGIKDYNDKKTQAYLLIDRQGNFYEIICEDVYGQIVKDMTPRLRVKKIGYKLENNEITSIIVVFENNSYKEYNTSISTYYNAFDSTLQIDKLLYKNK